MQKMLNCNQNYDTLPKLIDYLLTQPTPNKTKNSWMVLTVHHELLQNSFQTTALTTQPELCLVWHNQERGWGL